MSEANSGGVAPVRTYVIRNLGQGFTTHQPSPSSRTSRARWKQNGSHSPRDLGLTEPELPKLWDADFTFGSKTAEGEDTFVLGEINVSSVYPYPESAMQPLGEEFMRRL